MPLHLAGLLANECRSPRFEPFVTTALPDVIRQGDYQVFEVFARIPLAVCASESGERNRDTERHQQIWPHLLVLMACTVDLRLMHYLPQVVSCCPEQDGIRIYAKTRKSG